MLIYCHSETPLRRLAPADSTTVPNRDLVVRIVRIVRTELGSLTPSAFLSGNWPTDP